MAKISFEKYFTVRLTDRQIIAMEEGRFIEEGRNIKEGKKMKVGKIREEI